ncbi:MAG: arginine decarboxylase [Bacteroidetes bacterium GWF2_33_16]|nr:MAG: arginine decarboxylase [Bacteroidetes bacterium GWE2_32_14]OFY05235.1 MAG: arginine decarboxylase [Bacteroidetes bacterium GWF2_33_16]
MKKIFLLFIVLLFFSSCMVVKEYQKVNINDPDMALNYRKIDRFESNFQAYREAASGANGGKTGGGCGCN